MLGKVAKRAIAKIVTKALAYAQQVEDEREEGRSHEQDDFAYPWLNSLLTKLSREAGDGLRATYTWGVLQGAYLAKTLGVPRVSVIEFGVAGGNGLLSLERAAEKVGHLLGVGIDVYGFDTGTGLPRHEDYRDLPNLHREGSLRMDLERLKSRLTRAQLVLGPVASTVPTFIAAGFAPVAFIAFDLVYYSSTVHAFRLFEADQALLLPRIHCYFDDIMGFTFSDFNGERLAISEFNSAHCSRKISPIYALRYYLPAPHCRAQWPEKFFLTHIFDHEMYGRRDGLTRGPSLRFTELR